VKLKVSTCVPLSQTNCLKCPQYTHGDVCATHLLRHWSQFAPSYTPDTACTSSVHQRHELSSGIYRVAAAFIPPPKKKIVVNRIQIQTVGSHRSGEMKAGVSHSRRLIVLTGALSCWKIKNSPDVSRITASNCSLCSVISTSSQTRSMCR